MKKLLLVFLLLTPNVWAACPSRQFTYTAGQVIAPAEVTDNEDAMFEYLCSGVDVLAANAVTTSSILNGTILAADLSTGAVTTTVLLDDTILAADFADADWGDVSISSNVATVENLQCTNCVAGTELAFGSDAQGDVYYYNGTDVVRLGAGTSGQFLKTNGAGANPAWATVAMSAKVGTFTYDTSTASGTQAVTGVGFQPKALVLFAFVDATTGRASWGFTDGTTSENLADNETVSDDQLTGGTAVVNIIVSSGNTATAAISSLDADGFTLSWTKTGSPTGTAVINYLALK